MPQVKGDCRTARHVQRPVMGKVGYSTQRGELLWRKSGGSAHGSSLAWNTALQNVRVRSVISGDRTSRKNA